MSDEATIDVNNNTERDNDLSDMWIEMNVLLKETFDLRLCISAQNMRILKLEDCISTLLSDGDCVCVNLSKVKQISDENIHRIAECKIELQKSASEPNILNQCPSFKSFQENDELFLPYLSKQDTDPIHLQHMHGDLNWKHSKFYVKSYVFHEYDADQLAWPGREEKGIQCDSKILDGENNVWRNHMNLKISTYVNTDVYPVRPSAVDNSTQCNIMKRCESSVDVSIQSSSFVDDSLVEDSDLEK